MRNSSRTGFTGCGKTPHTFCHSERSEESLFPFTGLNLGEILRSAQNDKTIYFFRSLFSLRGVSLCQHQNPQAEQAAEKPAKCHSEGRGLPEESAVS